MRISTLLLVGLLTVPGYSAEKPDVKGTWQLDVGRSSFGNQPAPDSMTLNISEGKKKTLRISQTSTKPDDTRTVETECRLDGNFHPVDGPLGGSVRCKWKGDTLVSEKELSDGVSKLEMRLTVSPDRTTATEQLHVKGSSGVADSTLIWKRM